MGIHRTIKRISSALKSFFFQQGRVGIRCVFLMPDDNFIIEVGFVFGRADFQKVYS